MYGVASYQITNLTLSQNVEGQHGRPFIISNSNYWLFQGEASGDVPAGTCRRNDS